MRTMAAFLVALALAGAGGDAVANGRNPHTVAIHMRPGDPQTLYVSTTFGLVISKDEGCTFDWVCEQNIGYGGTWDPHYAVAADGAIFATTFEGLRVSRDGGCSFTTAAGTDGLWIDALAIGPTGEVWLGTAETGGVNDVLRSVDGGVTFQSRGMASAEAWWKSVAVAPSDARRVYITGYKVAGTPTGYFYRSDDGGAQWTPSALAGVAFGPTPVLRVRAVDPASPDVVYMTSEGATSPGDRLYRSADGGATWTEVLVSGATVQDVVIRDAQTVLVATQLRGTTALVGGPTYVSRDGGQTFGELEGAPRLACLTQTPAGTLLGCGANWEPDFKAIARSTDGGATWDKLWRFVEMNGALTCPAGTVQRDTCDVMLWDCPACGTDLKRQFGASGPACGPGASDAPVPRKNGGGCCDAGAPARGMWLMLAVAWFLRRRAR
jgi:hypothetical protein